MAPTRDVVMAELAKIATPSGGNLVRDDLVRALTVESGVVRFVIEAPSADHARALGAAQNAAETALRRLEGVTAVQVVLTAHGPSAKPVAAALPGTAAGIGFELPLACHRIFVADNPKAKIGRALTNL